MDTDLTNLYIMEKPTISTVSMRLGALKMLSRFLWGEHQPLLGVERFGLPTGLGYVHPLCVSTSKSQSCKGGRGIPSSRRA